MSTIELTHVNFFYGERPVINDVSLVVSPGITSVVVGASGSGKSVLLKVMAGLLPPHKGTVEVNHKNIFSFSEQEELAFRKKSSFVFQDGALWANRSVMQNVEFPLRVHFPELSSKEIRNKVEKTLSAVGYQDSLDYRPDQLSAGEQKMVSLARALITEPEMLFLDTPLVGIDSNAVEAIKQIINELRSKGRTIIAGFSDPELISMIADDLIVVHKGRVIAHGPFDEVKRSDDPAVQKILSMVLQELAAYDDDILSLLGEDNKSEEIR